MGRHGRRRLLLYGARGGLVLHVHGRRRGGARHAHWGRVGSAWSQLLWRRCGCRLREVHAAAKGLEVRRGRMGVARGRRGILSHGLGVDLRRGRVVGVHVHRGHLRLRVLQVCHWVRIVDARVHGWRLLLLLLWRRRRPHGVRVDRGVRGRRDCVRHVLRARWHRALRHRRAHGLHVRRLWVRPALVRLRLRRDWRHAQVHRPGRHGRRAAAAWRGLHGRARRHAACARARA
mmetsp:Transcript_8141/g.22397  ORF Transcript_8141/g.22397 Transcript_8141/m.22397 type:complete len:232 (-) Transcript_8141:264-959(-)